MASGFDRIPIAVCRAALRLYPPAFRDRFGPAMLRAFRDALAARAAARGRVAAAGWAIRALANTAIHGLAERRLARRRPGLSPSRLAPVRDLAQDLRFTMRRLRRSPAVALLSVLTLAVAIGATSTVFSLVDAALLRPLDLPDPDRIVTLLETDAGRPSLASSANVAEWQAQASSFEALAAFRAQTMNLTGIEEPAPVRGAFVSGDFFSVVGVPPARGRGLAPADDRPDAPAVAVISHPIWRQHYGSRDDVLGATIHLNNIAFTIVGVMPAGFYFPVDNARVWVPLRFGPGSRERDARNLIAFGRLRSAVSIDQAWTELNRIAGALAGAFPAANAGRGVWAQPLQGYLTAAARLPLILVFGLAIVLLAAACANLTSLHVGATAARRPEIGLRLALGASRVRIVRQLLAEHLAIATAGGLLGLVIAGRLVPLAVAYSPIQVFGLYRASVDWRAVAFAAAVTIATGIISAAVPAILWAGRQPSGALDAGSRSAGDRRLTRTRTWLVVGQVSLATVLLTSGAMLVKSYLALSAVDPGFAAADRLLTMEYRLPANRYDTEDRQRLAHEEMVARVAAVPGVRRAALVRALPFSGNGNVATYFTGDPASAPSLAAEFNTVTDEYFRIMRIPVLAGRTFDAADRADAPLVVVVSKTFAEQSWPGESALDREVTIPGMTVRPRVIGIVGDVRHRRLTEAVSPAFYARAAQNPGVFMTIVAETTSDPMAYVDAVRQAVWTVDRDQPVWKFRTLASLVDGSLQPTRSMFGALAIFGAAAVVLVVAGLYGVMSQSVSQRVREIGVRMVLGADRGMVLREVLGRGLRLTALGLALGLGGSFWIVGVMRGLLFETTPLDILPYVATVALVGVLAVVSCYVPARRAALIDPATTLRM